MQIITNKNGIGLVEAMQFNDFVGSAHSYTESRNHKAFILVANVSPEPQTIRVTPFEIQTCDNGKAVSSTWETEISSIQLGPPAASTIPVARDVKPPLRLSHLNIEDRSAIETVCQEFSDIFLLPGDKLTCTPTMQVKIPIKERTPPIFIKPYRIPQIFHEQVDKEVDKNVTGRHNKSE